MANLPTTHFSILTMETTYTAFASSSIVEFTCLRTYTKK